MLYTLEFSLKMRNPLTKLLEVFVSKPFYQFYNMPSHKSIYKPMRKQKNNNKSTN